jgi:hypothetical protein
MSETVVGPFNPANDYHTLEFHNQERAAINRVLAPYQLIRPEDATLTELQAFSAELVRIVLHKGHLVEKALLEIGALQAQNFELQHQVSALQEQVTVLSTPKPRKPRATPSGAGKPRGRPKKAPVVTTEPIITEEPSHE